ncbi:MAG: nuclease-related domain-containing protein [Acidimicrobiales bacterium]
MQSIAIAVLIALLLLLALAVLALLLVQARNATAVERRSRTRSPTLTVDEINKAKGLAGEVEVAKLLAKSLSARKYTIYNNVVISTTEGRRVTQIDHVVLSRFGLFVIETKAWPGELSLLDDDRWTQSLGRNFHYKNSPVKQNDHQIARLAERLDLAPKSLHGVVCFYGFNTDFRNRMPSNVVHHMELKEYIVGYRQEILSDEGLALAAETLSGLLDPESDR